MNGFQYILDRLWLYLYLVLELNFEKLEKIILKLQNLRFLIVYLFKNENKHGDGGYRTKDIKIIRKYRYLWLTKLKVGGYNWCSRFGLRT